MIEVVSHSTLSPIQYNELIKLASIVEYQRDEFLVYHGQTPQCAYYLIEGNLIVKENNKESFIPYNSLVCFEECYKKTPIRADLIVKAKTKVLIIYPSLLSQIYHLIKNQEVVV